MAHSIIVSPDAQALARDAAAYIAQSSRDAIAARSVPPRAAYQVLTTRPGIERPSVHLWWSDERDAPSDSADSNYRMAYHALIAHAPIPASHVHRVRTELGDDGHTASLFPGTLARLPVGRQVAAHDVPQAAMRRITFTPSLINAARRVAFLVSGKSKAGILARVRRGPFEPDALPAQAVAPTDDELVWLADADAASTSGAPS